MQKNSAASILHKLCWFLVVYTVLVIVWGAWVRISHSGNGCGNHWPLCDGAYIPVERDKKTLIEYFHRLTSGFYGIFVTGLLISCFKIYPKKAVPRKIAFVTFCLMIIEALLGAALVLKGLVGENATVFRVVVMTLHQMNSLLLTGSTVLLALATQSENINFQFHFRDFFAKGYNCLIFMLIPATGAWAALANTLFPSQNLQEGLQKDFSDQTPWILKLRVIHPILALLVGLFLVFVFFKNSEKTLDEKVGNASLRVAGMLCIALVFGVLTLLFLSPIWMKLVHLTLAQLVWISLVNYVMISLLSTKR
jgi:heme a synthase